jgi:hypothetical protein
MTRTRRQIIPIAGLLMTMAASAYMVARMHGQTTAVTADFSSAAIAEVRDAEGKVLLRGTFAATDEADDDIERRAVLASEGGGSGRGEAEVEISRQDRSKQEVEFSVDSLTPATALTFSIDGVQVATATTDDRGHAEIELDVTMPGARAAR